MSEPVVWSIVKNTSSFLVKRSGLALTREPRNVTNLNAYKYSGLARRRAVGVSVRPPVMEKRDAQVVLEVAGGKTLHKPAARVVHVQRLSKGAKTARKSIMAQVGASRPELSKAAVKRFTLLTASLKPKKATKRVRTGRRARKARRA